MEWLMRSYFVWFSVDLPILGLWRVDNSRTAFGVRAVWLQMLHKEFFSPIYETQSLLAVHLCPPFLTEVHLNLLVRFGARKMLPELVQLH